MNLRNIGEIESWDRFFDYLITVYYYRFRQQLNLPFDSLDNEPIIRFGGFVLEKPWLDENKKVKVQCGWHDREPLCQMGEVIVYTRTIYLNRLFLSQQLGLQVYFTDPNKFKELFNLNNLTKVISHELGHAILTDTNPKTQEINGGHGKEHDEISEKILKMIESSKEFKELKKYWK